MPMDVTPATTGLRTFAESRLDHGGIDLLTGEEVERHRGCRLEKRRPDALDRRRPSVDELHDVFLAHRNAVNEKPLAKIDEVGRRILADPESLRAKHRFERGAHTAFAVGTRDMKALQTLLRVAKLV